MKDAQKPDHVSLNALTARLREGRFVIPDFQREFEWKPGIFGVKNHPVCVAQRREESGRFVSPPITSVARAPRGQKGGKAGLRPRSQGERARGVKGELRFPRSVLATRNPKSLSRLPV